MCSAKKLFNFWNQLKLVFERISRSVNSTFYQYIAHITYISYTKRFKVSVDRRSRVDLYFIECDFICYQDIYGDCWTSLARLSLRITQSHCQVTDPLNQRTKEVSKRFMKMKVIHNQKCYLIELGLTINSRACVFFTTVVGFFVNFFTTLINYSQ